MTLKIFITVNTEKQFMDEVFTALNALKEVKEIHEIKDGSFQLIAMVQIADLELYRNFVERLAKIKSISDFESFITAAST